MKRGLFIAFLVVICCSFTVDAANKWQQARKKKPAPSRTTHVPQPRRSLSSNDFSTDFHAPSVNGSAQPSPTSSPIGTPRAGKPLAIRIEPDPMAEQHPPKKEHSWWQRNRVNVAVALGAAGVTLSNASST